MGALVSCRLSSPSRRLVQGVAGLVRFRRIMGRATPGEVPRFFSEVKKGCPRIAGGLILWKIHCKMVIKWFVNVDFMENPIYNGLIWMVYFMNNPKHG